MTFIHVLLGPFYTSLLCFHWSPTILNIVFYMSLCICILYVEINEMKNEKYNIKQSISGKCMIRTIPGGIQYILPNTSGDTS